MKLSYSDHHCYLLWPIRFITDWKPKYFGLIDRLRLAVYEIVQSDRSLYSVSYTPNKCFDQVWYLLTKSDDLCKFIQKWPYLLANIHVSQSICSKSFSQVKYLLTFGIAPLCTNNVLLHFNFKRNLPFLHRGLCKFCRWHFILLSKHNNVMSI